MNLTVRERVKAFCERFDTRLPILLAPMAGASAPPLSIAVMRAGGAGACGALTMTPDRIHEWTATVRAASDGPFQVNLWIPDPPPVRDADAEARVRAFLASWGPAAPEHAGDAVPPDFRGQCDALLAAAPPIVSSVMGVYPPAFVAALKVRRIAWFAVVSTVRDARIAEAAGADVIVAQGMEAGGHRAAFDAAAAERELVGLFSLLPAIVDAVRVPVVATGGIADGRGVAAALALGASAVQIGTAFLRCPESGIHPSWAAALGTAAPEDTIVSRVFSGRAGRSLTTAYVRAATASDAPTPAAYPVQRGLTAAMRADALRTGDADRMQAWAGQSARLGRAEPAAKMTARLWEDAQALLGLH
ncbi:MAG: nitronate monooxygenase [Vicinamibacterales bacterium]